MQMLRLPYLMAIVPVAALLTASFFVLFTLRKIEEKGLKNFGYLVVGLLWLAALVVFLGAVYKGSAAMKYAMQPKMNMDYMRSMMPRPGSAGMVMPEKAPLAKDQKCPGCVASKGIVPKVK
jgi:hypothetical protein